MKTGLYRYYFLLQFKRLYRAIEDFGLWPKLTISTLPVLYAAFCAAIKLKTDQAGIILIGLSFLVFLNLSSSDRHRFLFIHMLSGKYRALRMTENTLVSLPVLLGLILYEDYLLIPVLVGLVVVFSFWSHSYRFTGVIPTPFKNTPFENVVGFRKTWWLIAISYFIVIKGVQVDNFNLATSSLLLVFIVLLQFYGNLEVRNLVEVYRKTPREFLLQKTKHAALAYTAISLIPISVLCYYYPGQWYVFLAIVLFSFMYILCFIYAKYAAYPKNLTIPYTIIIVCSVIFPPIAAILMIYFFNKSQKYLRPFLS